MSPVRRSIAVLLTLAAALSASAAPPAAAAAPATDEVQIHGILAPVRIWRDTHWVPHVFARNDRDALFALGWVHAQDRFFQMDLLRRTFSGTLAELVGPSALPQDVQMRTLGLRRAAEASVPALETASRVWLTAYARGVNAWLASNPLPPEHAALELTPAGVPPWTPVDSVVIAKGLAFSLSFDLSDIDLTLAFSAFTTAGAAGDFDGAALFFADVYRSAPFDPAISIPGGPPQGALVTSSTSRPPLAAPSYLGPHGLSLAREYRERAQSVPLLRRALEARTGERGSNWWIASGAVTDSGSPLLANDPHLGLDVPAIFYEAQLRVGGGQRPPMNAFGVTFPGVPGIVLGCNPQICWGATTNPMDVTDVYLEQLVVDPVLGLPTHTLRGGVPEPLVVIPQLFRVNQLGNGVADDLVDSGLGPAAGGITLVVPRRNHGPLVAIDLSEPAQPVGLSVQYTGWGATTELDAFRRFNRASDLAQFVAGVQRFDVGSQNFAYADVDGNIAYLTSAEMPLREDLQLLERADGGVPPFFIRDGSHTLRHEWLPVSQPQPHQSLPYEILPYGEMPQEVNPARGWIANANNDPVGTTLDNDVLSSHRPDGGIYYLSPGYDGGFRMGRIERLIEGELAADGSLSTADFRRFQANNQLLDAELLTPHLLAAYENASGPGAGPALVALAEDPEIEEAIARLAAWDFSTPTGIPEGYDLGDALPVPPIGEIRNSVAATLYSTWRGQVLQRVIDGTLANLGVDAFAPPGGVALAALRNLLDSFPAQQGMGVSGVDFFAVAGIAETAHARDVVLLESLRAAIELLQSPAFAPAFDGSTDQDDYRWGRLHRIVFDHPLGEPFSIPPGGGLTHLAPGLPGVARSGGFGAVDASSHNPRADGVNEFMFGSGPARRFVGEMLADGPVCEEVIPGGTSGLPGNPYQSDQLLLWLTNRYHDWPYRPQDVADAAQDQEFLLPTD